MFHPGLPNTNKGDDYPLSWTEKVSYHIDCRELTNKNTHVLKNTFVCFIPPFQPHHTASTDDKSYSWRAHTQQEMEESPLRWPEGQCCGIVTVNEANINPLPFSFFLGSP